MHFSRIDSLWKAGLDAEQLQFEGDNEVQNQGQMPRDRHAEQEPLNVPPPQKINWQNCLQLFWHCGNS